jgi:hypothetical protein
MKRKWRRLELGTRLKCHADWITLANARPLDGPVRTSRSARTTARAIRCSRATGARSICHSAAARRRGLHGSTGSTNVDRRVGLRLCPVPVYAACQDVAPAEPGFVIVNDSLVFVSDLARTFPEPVGLSLRALCVLLDVPLAHPTNPR